MKYSNEKIEQMLQNYGAQSQIRHTLKARLLEGAAGGGRLRRFVWSAALCACAAAVFLIASAPKNTFEESPSAVINPADLDDSFRSRVIPPPNDRKPFVIDAGMIDNTKILTS
jgi:hypothetical protein